MDWTPQIDRAAQAAAEADGWVWTNLDRRRREYWRMIAFAVLENSERIDV